MGMSSARSLSAAAVTYAGAHHCFRFARSSSGRRLRGHDRPRSVELASLLPLLVAVARRQGFRGVRGALLSGCPERLHALAFGAALMPVRLGIVATGLSPSRYLPTSSHAVLSPVAMGRGRRPLRWTPAGPAATRRPRAWPARLRGAQLILNMERVLMPAATTPPTTIERP